MFGVGCDDGLSGLGSHMAGLSSDALRERLVHRLGLYLHIPGVGKVHVEFGVPQHEYPERSEEHTSELQSLTNLVCRLLLEKKNINTRLKPVRQHTTVEININQIQKIHDSHDPNQPILL